MKTSPILFKKTTGEEVSFEDLLRKIYENSEERHAQIIATADHVTSKINEPADAMALMPSLIELQKVAVKNDDQLINMASIIQRTMAKSSKSEDEGFNISAEDRRALLEAAKRSSLPAASSDV
jgi:hypothetical protein